MTAGYFNACSFTQVIAADNRDPFVSWRNHRARGSRGGVDLVAQVGTQLFAPADCTISNLANNGNAGDTVTMTFADGWQDQYMHLSGFVTPGNKLRGELVGFSGNTGGVVQHIHWHRTDPSGNRQNPWDSFGGGGAGGFSGAAWGAITADVQQKVQQFLTNIGLYTGLVDGMWGSLSWKAIQTFLGREGLYGGPADGDPGVNTIMGLQKLAARGGYDGPIDGEFGPRGTTGLNTWLDAVLATQPAAGGPFGLPIPAELQKRVQELLTRLGLYSGLIDGEWGALSWAAIQTYLGQLGVYDGPADGDPGTFTYQGLQHLAARAGYTGPVDGVLGEASIEGLNRFVFAELATLGGHSVTTASSPSPASGVAIPMVPSGHLFGVDIGTSQASMDMAVFRAAGAGFAIIKQGGGNASDSPYIAPKYPDQEAASRAAALPIGHYWFNGQKLSVAGQAEFFAQNIKLRDGDLIALDVEAEMATGTRAFTPAEVLEFIGRFRSMHAAARFLVYMSRSVVTEHDWSPVVAAGHGLWVAAWGANDGTIPASKPELLHWPHYAIWQYTSEARVPGFDSRIDADIATADVFANFGYKKAA